MKEWLKLASIAGVLTLSLVSPAWASYTNPDFDRDMRMAFENDGEPMELALLSEQEMRETEGAYVPLAVYRFVYGGVSGAFVYWIQHDLYPSFDARGLVRHFVYGGTVAALGTSHAAAALAAAGVAVVAKGYDPDYR